MKVGQCLEKSVFKQKVEKTCSLVRHSSVLICLQTNCYTISATKKVELQIKEIPWHLEFLFASHFSR